MRYYIKKNGTLLGPFTKNEIQSLLNRGCLFTTDLAAVEGDSNFRSLLELNFKPVDKELISERPIVNYSNSQSIYKRSFLAKAYELYWFRANFWVCLTAIFILALNLLKVISFNEQIEINFAAFFQHRYLISYLLVITVLIIIRGTTELESGIHFYITDVVINAHKKLLLFLTAICILVLPLFLINIIYPDFLVNHNRYAVLIIYSCLTCKLLPLPIYVVSNKLHPFDYLSLTWNSTKGLKTILLLFSLFISIKLVYPLVALIHQYEISRGYGKIPLTIIAFILFLQFIIFAVIAFTVYCIELKDNHLQSIDTKSKL